LAPVIALAVLAGGIAYAQQNLPVPAAPSSPATGAPKAQAPAAQAPADSVTPTPSDRDVPAAPPSTAGKGSPQRFEPSEKVRPDFDVAFPVDI
jgi:hypothetical protein